MKVLVTGAAGFIGMHTSERLLARGDEVVGIDNLNDYYPVVLKQARLDRLVPHSAFRFLKMDIADADELMTLFEKERFDAVVHLAAQAGVRYSLQNPQAYIQSNLVGFANVLEACRRHPVSHLVYASSSSVYGGNKKVPFEESDPVDCPVSLYAATKKSNELMAYSYSHLYGIPATGLRFFTVYGPWGRPDMAYWGFAEKILAGQPIDVFNHGDMRRDFTYVDDIVEGVVRLLGKPMPADSEVRHQVFNIGNNQPVQLLEFISCLEEALGRVSDKRYLPMQDGDVPATYASTRRLDDWCGFRPETPLKNGLAAFVAWYRGYAKGM